MLFGYIDLCIYREKMDSPEAATTVEIMDRYSPERLGGDVSVREEK